MKKLFVILVVLALFAACTTSETKESVTNDSITVVDTPCVDETLPTDSLVVVKADTTVKPTE